MTVTSTIEIGNSGSTEDDERGCNHSKAKREVEEHVAAVKEKLATALDEKAISDDMATALHEDLHHREEKALELSKLSDLNPVATVQRAYHTAKIDTIGDTAERHVNSARIKAVGEALTERIKQYEQESDEDSVSQE